MHPSVGNENVLAALVQRTLSVLLVGIHHVIGEVARGVIVRVEYAQHAWSKVSCEDIILHFFPSPTATNCFLSGLSMGSISGVESWV